MIEELRASVSALLPLRVGELEFNDPVVVLAGSKWSLSIVCPWRLTRGGALVTSIEDPGAEAHLRELVGASIVEIVAQTGWGTARDPAFVFADGARLELFADTDLDPWVMRLPDKTFVGSASDPGATETEGEACVCSRPSRRHTGRALAKRGPSRSPPSSNCS